jgi:hypothetical protein
LQTGWTRCPPTNAYTDPSSRLQSPTARRRGPTFPMPYDDSHDNDTKTRQQWSHTACARPASHSWPTPHSRETQTRTYVLLDTTPWRPPSHMSSPLHTQLLLSHQYYNHLQHTSLALHIGVLVALNISVRYINNKTHSYTILLPPSTTLSSPPPSMVSCTRLFSLCSRVCRPPACL